jgi:hypothetical protein
MRRSPNRQGGDDFDLARTPRIEDLPYYTSPPVLFIYQSTMSLAGGVYLWNDQPSPLTPLRPIVDNAAYYFRSITLSADISELDYTAAIVDAPRFYTFLTGDANAVLFREPVTMVKFYQNFDYRFLWSRQKGDNQLLCAFRGSLIQIPNLVGKAAIQLTAIISAQEITDVEFTNAVKEPWASTGGAR